jgi:2-hydroxymuconate-semialdehyde hydrolase
MASAEPDHPAIRQRTLVIHGRDDRVIPLANSLTLNQWIDDSQLHVFGRCGHWVQIEHSAEFNRLVAGFLAD